MRKLLARELQLARQRLTEGATDQAVRHIGIALRLFEAAPLGTIPPQVGNATIWADRASMNSDKNLVLLALDLGECDDRGLHGREPTHEWGR